MVFLTINIIAQHINKQGQEVKLPYTAACGPLAVVVTQRFIWYRAVLKSFKNPQNLIKYLYMVFILILILNFSLRADEYVSFEVIALLWPCYGLIALTFIFFAASLLLFVSSACNQMTSMDEGSFYSNGVFGHERSGSVFNCTTSSGLLMNCSYFLGFSIVGFISLLKEIRGEDTFTQGLIGLVIGGLVCCLFIIC